MVKHIIGPQHKTSGDRWLDNHLVEKQTLIEEILHQKKYFKPHVWEDMYFKAMGVHAGFKVVIDTLFNFYFPVLCWRLLIEDEKSEIIRS